jgi:hypothetical protein
MTGPHRSSRRCYSLGARRHPVPGPDAGDLEGAGPSGAGGPDWAGNAAGGGILRHRQWPHVQARVTVVARWSLLAWCRLGGRGSAGACGAAG